VTFKTVRLTEMLLQAYPELRRDGGMMRGYMFLLDFLEAVGNETKERLKKNQDVMKGLLEAMKTSAEALDEYISSNVDKVQQSRP
jgi:hypothetical protein